MKKAPTASETNKEIVAELLKERIYATLALLAVLISIDPSHITPLKAGILVIGTVVSLWLASLVASQMARRIVFRDSNDSQMRKHQLRIHSPMLVALIFPTLMISLAHMNIFPLTIAIDAAILSALILLVAWSILSARSLHTAKIPLIILAVLELSVGMGVVALKIAIGH